MESSCINGIKRCFYAALVVEWGTFAACVPAVRPAVSWQNAPAYSAEERALFGDSVAPEVFDLPGQIEPRKERQLAARALRADAILKVKATTLIRIRSSRGEPAYSIALTVLEPPLQGVTPDQAIEVTVPASSPTYAFLEAARDNWLDEPLLLFLRYYAEDQALTLHFHAEPSTPEVLSQLGLRPGWSSGAR